MNKSSRTWIWVIVIIIIILGIWYFASMSTSEQVAPTTASTSVEGTSSSSNVEPNTAKPGVVPLVSISSDSTVGSHLVASNGMTLYTYSKDAKGVSNCSGACADTWPPYTTTSSTSLIAGPGVSGDFSFITRADGSKQLTYKGMPLYFYASDANTGDVTGQNVGSSWFVVKP